MLSPPQSHHGDSYPNNEYDHSDITPKVTPSATLLSPPPRINNDDDDENEDNTHEEEVRVAIGFLVKYCFNNNESCYHLRSLLTSICKEYDLHLAVGPPPYGVSMYVMSFKKNREREGGWRRPFVG